MRMKSAKLGARRRACACCAPTTTTPSPPPPFFRKKTKKRRSSSIVPSVGDASPATVRSSRCPRKSDGKFWLCRSFLSAPTIQYFPHIEHSRHVAGHTQQRG